MEEEEDVRVRVREDVGVEETEEVAAAVSEPYKRPSSHPLYPTYIYIYFPHVDDRSLSLHVIPQSHVQYDPTSGGRHNRVP
jgi:hypothetical protein